VVQVVGGAVVQVVGGAVVQVVGGAVVVHPSASGAVTAMLVTTKVRTAARDRPRTNAMLLCFRIRPSELSDSARPSSTRPCLDRVRVGLTTRSLRGRGQQVPRATVSRPQRSSLPSLA
jgi:hypothetical protein